MADDNNGILPLVSVLSEFESVFGQPESYLKPPTILQKNTLSAIKQIFDFCKRDELSGTRSLASTCPLQELLVEDFDDEQIWQEIELQNTPLLRVLKQDVHSLKENVDQLSLSLGRLDDVVSENANGFVKNASESDTESDRVNEGFSSDENSDDPVDDSDVDASDDGEKETDDDNNDSKKVKSSTNNNRKQKSAKKSQVDDSFFKLSDMLQFLDKEDRRYDRAHRKKSQKESDDDDDDNEIDSEPVDYFINMDSDDTEEEEDEEWSKALGVTESLLGRCMSILVHLFNS